MFLDADVMQGDCFLSLHLCGDSNFCSAMPVFASAAFGALLLPVWLAAAGLSSEQKALVDFIVLAGGQGFVGFGSSTFSFYLREYRALKGVPRASSVLVDASAIGTDSLFRAAGTVTL